MPSRTSLPAEPIFDVVQYISEGSRSEAERELRAVFAAADREDTSSLTRMIFAAALARRVSPATSQAANLYLADYEVPQIRLFNLLAEHLPQVGLAGQIANDLIARSCAGREEVVIVDVGIGTGRQIIGALEQMAATGSLPQRLCVVGIEPMEWSLETAERDVSACAARLGAELTFVGLCGVAEALTDRHWERIAKLGRRPIVNASFALHHVMDAQDAIGRDLVLARLRALAPEVVILSEPNVDHFERDYAQRFANCWAHFGTTFTVIDALAISNDDKAALKVFMGREISDILGSPESERSERHETTETWLRRLERADLQPTPVTVALPDPRGAITPRRHEHFVGLDYGDETLVSVLCARPGGEMAAA